MCNLWSCTLICTTHKFLNGLVIGQSECYNPPYIFPGSHSPDPMTICLPDKLPVLKDQPPIIFPSATPPNLMSKQLLPMNPLFVEDLPPHVDTPCPMSTEPLPEPLVLEPLVEPLVPIPWNIHCCQYSSMEEFVKYVMQNLVFQPMDDLDSPMMDMPPLEPDPVMPYLPDSPEGHIHTLSPDKSPTEPWQQWLDNPDLGFRVGGRQHERSEGWMCGGWLRGVEAESTEGGCAPSSLSFDLICLIRTPIQTEIQT